MLEVAGVTWETVDLRYIWGFRGWISLRLVGLANFCSVVVDKWLTPADEYSTNANWLLPTMRQLLTWPQKPNSCFT